MNNPPNPRRGHLVSRGASDSVAALQGANLAFFKSSRPKPIPPVKNIGARHSALTAATTSATRDRSRSRSPAPPLSRHISGGSFRDEAEHQCGRDGASDTTSRKEPMVGPGAISPTRSTTGTAYMQPSSASGIKPTLFDPKNTSFIAATLAASRSASPSPRAKSPSLGNQLQGSAMHVLPASRAHRRESIGSSMSSTELPDTSSIAPTNSLISMFEGPREYQVNDMDPVKRGVVAPLRMTPTKKPRGRPAHRPITPERPASSKMGHAKPDEPKSVTQPPRTSTSETPPAPEAQSPLSPSMRRARSPMITADTKLSQQSSNTRVPQADDLCMSRPPQLSTRRRVLEIARQPQTHIEYSPPEAAQPHLRPKSRRATPPQPRGSTGETHPPARLSGPATNAGGGCSTTQPGHSPAIRSSEARPTTSSTTSSNDTFVSAASEQDLMFVSSPPRQDSAPRVVSSASVTANSPYRIPAPPLPRRTPTTTSSSSLPLHSLSNAIVAGSLAAARLTPSNTGASTGSPGPALPQSRHGKSPRLRQTLRQPISLSDDETEARRIKKHHGHHTHSNKKHFHHEGARKRWREEIKPNERKRYEALWASNKGLLAEYLMPTTTSSTDTMHLAARNDTSPSKTPRAYFFDGYGRREMSEFVLDIVVREIWRRCRLPDDELAEVWELVANHAGSGRKSGTARVDMLDKQQFVVGTWVIDQRLRGRKIPAKVSASVWDSAKGVRVSTPKLRKEGARVRK